MLTPTQLLTTLCFIPLAGSSTQAQRSQPTASQMMTHAERAATAEHKNILLKFSASWCGECRLYEAFLKDASNRRILNKHFVIVEMITAELPNHPAKGANTPGVAQLEYSFAHQQPMSIPYTVVTDAKGRKITSPLWYDGNLGFPVTPIEEERFMRLLSAGAPSMSATDASVIANWLSAHRRLT